MIPDITAGETINYTQTFADYDPSTDTLVFDCVTDGAIETITATDNGDGSFLVNVPYGTTASWTAGVYHYQAHITSGATREFVEEGSFEVTLNFAAQVSGYDNRSHVKKTLDALESTIEGKASQDQLSYSIAGRSLARMSPTEILEWRDKYKRFYAEEVKAEKLASGETVSSKVYVRMPA